MLKWTILVRRVHEFRVGRLGQFEEVDASVTGRRSKDVVQDVYSGDVFIMCLDYTLLHLSGCRIKEFQFSTTGSGDDEAQEAAEGNAGDTVEGVDGFEQLSGSQVPDL